MDLQNRQAVMHGYTYAQTSQDVRRLIESGALVPVTGNLHFMVKESVAFPYARPAVRDFITQLAKRYYDACGEQLVVTSLTRARNRQPRNASKRSVHPTGMAMDLRRSWDRGCRSWIEMTLLTLEVNGVLDAMLESSTPSLPRGALSHRLAQQGRAASGTRRADPLSGVARRYAVEDRQTAQYRRLLGQEDQRPAFRLDLHRTGPEAALESLVPDPYDRS